MSVETTGELQALAAQTMERALRAGATDAEAVAFEADEFSVHVRLGEIEQLVESGSRALGLRVFVEAGGGLRVRQARSGGTGIVF